MRFITLSLLFCSQLLFSQSIVIKGRITDADTKEGIPFANIFFESTTKGTQTDVDGYYTFITERVDDSLTVSALGYTKLQKILTTELEQIIDFEMKSSSVDITEVIVYAGENPANEIVRKIIKNKAKNKLSQFELYAYEAYKKVEMDLESEGTERLKERKAFKKMDFVFENIDSTSDEIPFLPVYMQETLSDVFVKKKKQKEMLKARQTSGVDNETVIRFIERMHDPHDVYENWIPILEKNFVSPFSNQGLLFYEYYVMDSTMISDKRAYKLKFKPKRKQENTFYGDFWIADTSFAVIRVNMRMVPDANLNLVDRVVIYDEYQLNHDLWLPSKQKMIVSFKAVDFSPALIGRKTEMYQKYQLNNPKIEKTFDDVAPEDIVAEDLEKSTTFWDSVRYENLSINEANVYTMIDSIQNTKEYQRLYNIVYSLAGDFILVKKIEFGPYSGFYSANAVEGHRFKFGIATSNNFSKKFRIATYAAYGTKDKKWKYGGNLQWNIIKKPRRFILGARYTDDIIFSHNSSEDPVTINLFSGYFRRDVPIRLAHTQEAKIFLLKDWKKGWTNRLTIMNRRLDPYGLGEGKGFNFKYLSNPLDVANIDTTFTTTELLFSTRFAFKEEYWQGEFDRVSISCKYPIVEFKYVIGLPNILGSEYNYHRLSLEISQWFFVNPIGWLRYNIKTGKTFGTLPYLLLEIPQGNDSYFYQENSFNVMNRYEFATDYYLSWVAVHHFDGFLLNHIPLMRKLQWRSLVSFRGIWGTMTDENSAVNQLNSSDVGGTIPLRSPSPVPYMEASIGIENIFKVFSIHGIWRLNYLDNPETQRFMLQGSAYFYF